MEILQSKRVGTLYYDVDGILLDFVGPFVEYWNEGLKKKKWNGKLFDKNPETWTFGLRNGIDDMSEMNKAIEEFHDYLPVMHGDISKILKELKSRYRIELITAYPDESKRIENLRNHNIPYDKLTCNINDKLSYIQEREKFGDQVVAIFEDGPYHLERFLPYYGNKLWAPNYWNHIKKIVELDFMKRHMNGRNYK